MLYFIIPVATYHLHYSTMVSHYWGHWNHRKVLTFSPCQIYTHVPCQNGATGKVEKRAHDIIVCLPRKKTGSDDGNNEESVWNVFCLPFRSLQNAHGDIPMDDVQYWMKSWESYVHQCRNQHDITSIYKYWSWGWTCIHQMNTKQLVYTLQHLLQHY